MTIYTDNNGQLKRGTLVITEDGAISLGQHYNPVTLTPVGTTTLRGWGKDDGEADVYKIDGGGEIVVPDRHRARVRHTVNA